MPNGVGQGIASGITNAIALGLRSQANDIRRERTEALETAETNRLQFSKSQAEQEFEAGQPGRDLERIERDNALKQAEKEKVTLDAAGFLDKTVGDNRTRTQEKLLQQFLDVKLFGEKRNGLFPEASIERVLKEALDIENPDTSGSEFFIEFFNAGAEDANNEAEVREQKLEKLVKKDPLLAKGNPRAFDANQEAAELKQSIEELRATIAQFRSQGAEADEVRVQSVQKEKARREERNTKQAEIVENIFSSRNQEGADFVIKTDELGNLVRIDKNTGQRLPIQDLPGTTQDAQITQRPDPFITARESAQASGPISGLKRAFAAILGPFIPGEQATGTVSAVNKINNLNKQLVQTLVLSKRFPVFEQAQIQGFLIKPGKILSDPAGDSGKLIDLKSFLSRKKLDLENQLNQTISAEQRKENIGKIGNIDIAINLLPPEIALKAIAQREITTEEIRNTSVEEIRRIAKETIPFFSKEIRVEMLRKIDETDSQSGASGSF